MIFSGKPPNGHGSVWRRWAITLENEDHSLPIDYSEVTIGCRAYRIRARTKLPINGNRVRLRDISDLLSAAGLSRRTYAVIGHFVDAALSLRPEERRVLFEEAAGIAGYQTKRADAVNRL